MEAPRRLIGRWAMGLAALVLLVACASPSAGARNASSPTTPASSPTTAASSPPTYVSTTGTFPSPTPGGPAPVSPAAMSCSSAIPAGAQLALVTLRGVPGIVVRDLTHIDYPVTRCTFAGGSYFRFRDATHVSYIAMAGSDLGAPGSLYLADLQAHTTSLVRSWSYGGYMSWVYNWSPDGQLLTYLSSDTSGVEWHLLSASGDRTLSKLGTMPARGVDTDVDDAMVGFSADGQYVSVAETITTGPAAPFQVVRISDGKVVYSRTDGAMAVWLGRDAYLYFKTSKDVQYWDPSGVHLVFTTGAKGWIHPSQGFGGKLIVFTGTDPQGNHHPSVLQWMGGPSPLIPDLRVGAIFITLSEVWWAGESPGGGLTGKTYIYDIGAHTEAVSIETAVYDVWPHTLGQLQAG